MICGGEVLTRPTFTEHRVFTKFNNSVKGIVKLLHHSSSSKINCTMAGDEDDRRTQAWVCKMLLLTYH